MFIRRELSLLGLFAGLLGRSNAQAAVNPAGGIHLNLDSDDSIKAAAKLVAANMMTYYNGDQPGGVPGLLPAPYYWWETGAMFGQLIHYWSLTGDTAYNDRIKEALLFQIGDNKNYMPANRTKDLGNDDQAFWAFSAMDAAEYGFENPSDDQPSWLSLAQAVFNGQISRWETSTCGGGLRWQIYPFNAGYQYKNTISNGALFQLSARLARYTGNQTYSDWAEKTYNWIFNSPIMKAKYDSVWDGTSMINNCSDATEVYWTYNAGTMLMGSAFMYNATNGDPKWEARVRGFLKSTDIFFVKTAGPNAPPKAAPPGGSLMSEVACEFPEPQTCNYDQPSFKAYLSRWMAVASQLAPFAAADIRPRLKASAIAAAAQCAGQQKNMCGRRWYQDHWDGFFGVGEQMSALSVFQNNLIDTAKAPFTAKTGGNSKSDPGAGTGDDAELILDPALRAPITTADRAGAGILTFISIVMVLSGSGWMIL